MYVVEHLVPDLSTSLQYHHHLYIVIRREDDSSQGHYMTVALKVKTAEGCFGIAKRCLTQEYWIHPPLQLRVVD